MARGKEGGGMAVLTVRLYGDPVLRQKAAPVSAVTPEIERVLEDMVETMGAEGGIGLAATQVGIGLRMLVVDEGRGASRPCYLNPVIVEQGGEQEGEEGCLSLPGIYADVRRAEWVVVSALDATGAPRTRRATGLLARVFQHEIDHLDGVLFIDRLDKVTRDRIKRQIRREGFPEGMHAGAGAL
jgi:peptide deformylase